MKYLFDTNAFIWWESDPTRLSAQVLAICQNPLCTLLLSVASAWEMQIKVQLGKLKLPRSLSDIIDDQKRLNAIQILPIGLPHVMAIQGLPSPHKDPFDRVLVAQAIVEGIELLSCDPIFSQYPVKVLW